MTPSAIQMMPPPISEVPLFREGSAPVGTPAKSPDGFSASGMNQASRPVASGEPVFSQILAEQAAEPQKAATGENPAVVTGPGYADPREPEIIENTGTASGEESTDSGLPAGLSLPLPLPLVPPDLPPAPVSVEQVEILAVSGTDTSMKGSVELVNAPAASGADATGKIFPAPPAVEGMPSLGDTLETGSITEQPITNADTRHTGSSYGIDGEGAGMDALEQANAMRTETDSSAADSLSRPDNRPVSRQSTGNAPAADSETVKNTSAPNSPSARVASPAESEGTAEILKSAAGEKNTVPVNGEIIADAGQKNQPARTSSNSTEQPTASLSRTPDSAPEGGNSAIDPGRQALSASAAGTAVRKQSGQARQDTGQEAAGAGVAKVDIRTKKISSSAPFDVRRTESGPERVTAKGQENKPATEIQAKQAAAADATTFRDTVEQASQPGVERAASGNSGGEAQGALAAAKTPFLSHETSSESLRDPSAVLKQASDAWATAAEKTGTDGGRVRIVLSPEHLGNLDMDVRVRKESVKIMMSVQREESLHTLRGHAAELRTALSDQGLRVESLSMQTSGRDFQSNGGFSGGYGSLNDGRNMNESNSHGSGSGRRNGESGTEARQPAAGTAPRRTTTDGISVFA